jgi:hypothetical protein
MRGRGAMNKIFTCSRKAERGPWKFRGVLLLGLTLFQIIVLLYSTTLNAAPAISNIQANNNVIGRYEKFELSFEVTGSYSNPFDPGDIKVDGHFITPASTELVQPGFYYQEYNRNGNAIGSPVWKIRFAPKQLGPYTYFIRADDGSGAGDSPVQSFEVTASDKAGFLRVSVANRRYFEFENMQPFFGVGMNVCWGKPADYEYFFNRMNNYKCNIARVWMVNSTTSAGWVFSIQDRALGADYNLKEACDVDYMIDLAEEKGIYLDFTLDDVNSVSDHNWYANLYNSANGGPVPEANREQILTNAAANTYQKRVFRYVVARWAYSTNILSFEFWNEIDELRWSSSSWSDYDLVDWHREMAQYIRSLDPHNHIINTSTGSYKVHPYLYEALPEMEYAQIHLYGTINPLDYAETDSRDFAWLIQHYAKMVYNSVSNEPSVIGEYGCGGDCGFYGVHDNDGIFLHNAHWASTMNGMASTAWYWFWNNLRAQSTAWWETYPGIANYVNGINFNTSGIAIMDAADFSVSNDKLRFMGLKDGSNAVYCWIQNTEHTWYAILEQGQMTSPQSGTITIRGMDPAKMYRLQRWDTYAGSVTGEENLPSDGSGNLTFSLSNMSTDMAIKIFHPDFTGMNDEKSKSTDSRHTDGLYLPYEKNGSGRIPIEYSLSINTYVELAVYDIYGRRVRTLVAGRLNRGEYETEWNTEEVAVGVYFIRLQKGSHRPLKHMIVKRAVVR